MSKIDLETAKSIARGFLESSPSRLKSKSSKPSSLDDLSIKFIARSKLKVHDSLLRLSKGETIDDGDPCFYVFDNANSGYIFISANDTDNPILGMTDIGANDFNDIPPGLVDLMEAWRQSSMSKSDMSDSAPSLRVTTRWEEITKYHTIVEPLIKTKWNQRHPYNYYCPLDKEQKDMDYYVSGCTAIAMAQVIRYYEWPKIGKGTHQSDDSSTPFWDFMYNEPDADSRCPGLSNVAYECGSDSLKIDYGSTHYDYLHMPSQAEGVSYGAKKLPEDTKWPAALVRHCATAVNMDFWAEHVANAYSHPNLWKEGGALNQSYIMGLDALHEHFRYNKASEKYHLESGWGKDVRESLDDCRPVMFYSLLHAHVFICDGYGRLKGGDKYLYHFNFGWAGNWDGFFYYEGEINPNKNGYQTIYVCSNLRPENDFKNIDVVFNIPGYNPIVYPVNYPVNYPIDEETPRQKNTVERIKEHPIFPFGKTPAILGYDRVYRLYPEQSVDADGIAYCLDSIRYNGVETKIEAKDESFTIPSSILPSVNKIEVLLRPTQEFVVDGITYRAIRYNWVEVVDCSATGLDVPSYVSYNGLDYSVVGVDFDELVSRGRNRTIESIKANHIQRISDVLSHFTKLKEVEFNIIRAVPSRAFNGLAELKTVHLIAVQDIGEYSFNNCTSLETLYFPNLVSLGKNAFKGCRSLKSFDAKDLREIKEGVFHGCSSLETVSFNKISIIQANAFKDCKKLPSMDMELTVSIGEYAFENCESLNEVNIRSKDVQIGSGAFSGCSGLSSFSAGSFYDGCLPENVFYGCRQLKTISPKEIKNVGTGCFTHCNLTHDMSLGDVGYYGLSDAFTDSQSPVTISLEPFCKKLGDNAFSGSTSICSIYSFAKTPPVLGKNVFKGVPSDIPVFVPSQALQEYKDDDGWKYFKNITGMVVTVSGVKYDVYSPDRAKVIGCDPDIVMQTRNHVFGNVTREDSECIDRLFGDDIASVLGVDLPACLTIKKYITVNNRTVNVTSIEPDAFKEKLDCLSIYLEGDCSIPSGAFLGCTKIKAIALNASTPPSIQHFAVPHRAKIRIGPFENSVVTKDTVLLVPNNAVEQYKSSSYWSQFTIIPFASIFKNEIPANVLLDDKIKKEYLQWCIHDKYYDPFHDLLGLVSKHWRDVPSMFANSKELSQTASDLFDRVNDRNHDVEIILPNSIKDKLDGAESHVSSDLLKKAINCLGKLQVFGSEQVLDNIDDFIMTKEGLLSDVVKYDRLEIKYLAETLNSGVIHQGINQGILRIGRKPLPGRQIEIKVYNRISPVNDYEDDLAFAAQQFTDLLYSALTPYESDGEAIFQGIEKPWQGVEKPIKGTSFIGLFLNKETALKALKAKKAKV